MSAALVAMVTKVGRQRSQAPTSTHLYGIFVLMSQRRQFELVQHVAETGALQRPSGPVLGGGWGGWV